MKLIDITYPSLRVKKESWRDTWKPPEKSFTLGSPIKEETGTLWAETRRRDDIIKRMANDCKYVEGEVVTLHNAEARAKYGERVTVSKICDSYAKYQNKNNKQDWPKNDLPMIVFARDIKRNISFFCTPNYLVPLNPDGSTPEDKAE